MATSSLLDSDKWRLCAVGVVLIVSDPPSPTESGCHLNATQKFVESPNPLKCYLALDPCGGSDKKQEVVVAAYAESGLKMGVVHESVADQAEILVRFFGGNTMNASAMGFNVEMTKLAFLEGGGGWNACFSLLARSILEEKETGIPGMRLVITTG
jgi:hypothetical protein